jgi:hypothetical protein
MAPAYTPAMAPIRNFAAAVESADVQKIKQAYPGLTPNQQKNWENVFKQSKVTARVQSPRGVSMNEAAGTYVVEFVMAMTFSDRATGSEVAVRPSRYRATLKREGSNLVIVSLTDVTRR